MKARQFSAAVRERRCLAERLEDRCLFAGDLTGSFAGVVPTQFLPGGKNKLTVAVRNIGDTDVTDAFRVALFASTDDTFSDDDIRFFSVDKHSKLKAGGAKATNVILAFPTPANIPDGSYRILAKIDETNGIAEGDENNNLAVTPATVGIKQPFVDITGTAEVVGGTFSIVEGKKPKAPKIALAVTNSGNVTAAGTVTATVFASTDNAVGGGNDTQIGTVTKKLNAKPGKATKLAAKVTLPSDLRSGDYNIVATYAYAGTLVQESDTTNNDAASTGKITIDNPAFPPLPPGPTVSALSVDSAVLAVGSPEQLIFDVSITSIPAGDSVTAELTEVTADGTVIGKVADLLDNGISTNSDAVAGDGIFSTNTAIQLDAPGDRFFRATITGTTESNTPAIKITGITPPSDEDVQNTINNANNRQAALNAAVGAGMAPSAAIQQSAQNLASQPDVVPGSIQMGPNALAYLNFQGILTYLQAQQPGAAPQSAAVGPEAAALAAADSTLDCGCGGDPASAADDPATACARALLLDPGNSFLGVNDPTPALAQILLNPLGGGSPTTSTFNVATRTGAEATVDSFKNLGQNRIIAIAAESFDVPGFGVGIKTGEDATVLSRLANVADLASNRLAISGDGKYVVTPKFFTHYNGDMDNAIALLDFSSSLTTEGPALNFTRRGALAVFGFDGPIRTTFGGPQITGTLSALSDFNTTVETALSGINSRFDPSTGSNYDFIGTGEGMLTADCDLLSDNDLVITYTWNQNVRDLDTGTEFLGDSVGFSCGAGNEFMTFTGDNTSGGGSETVTIDLSGAFAAGRFTGSTMVSANAGWYSPAGGSGPAVLTVSLKNKTTGELRQTLTRSISPGTQSGCASTLVGNITVNVTSEASPRVSITLA